MTEQVVVGRVAKAHGIRGELAVDVRTDSPDERFVEGAVLTGRTRGGDTLRLTVAAARWHSGRLLVRFEEVPDRTAAETHRGLLLLADAGELPPIDDPDEFYDHELEGLSAELADGTVVGTVREVVHSPGGELLVVDREGLPEVLVPFVRAIVPEVDVQARRVVLDPPEGLLEDSDADVAH
ncbi:ribosome maturation factor RimM [Prauserella rugosa]|uniref:Ribosome maturation factor RimM n=1 Tax=Prauserella rugosa TaxID=43354 RepID=A0A660CLY8_9PSEU|nr:ribosome maturation factor RimM [Prauserella rugosa]KID31132.1 16S rRNA processing protein RimM [Prauserella sp. Am3]KMS85715.1 16S rRNA processing protein RimM [Streptomyces regensis]TWH22907.1 16S rRNA processing protein RimM [Prauserella rugosa]